MQTLIQGESNYERLEEYVTVKIRRKLLYVYLIRLLKTEYVSVYTGFTYHYLKHDFCYYDNTRRENGVLKTSNFSS